MYVGLVLLLEDEAPALALADDVLIDVDVTTLLTLTLMLGAKVMST